MFTLLFGIVLVVGSAAVFGLALFGRRPVPQPATAHDGSPLSARRSETGPSSTVTTDRRHAGATAGTTSVVERPVADDGLTTKVVPWWQRVLQRDETAEHVDASDVALSGWVRFRSALLLALTVAGLAALLGVVASLLVVGVGLLFI